MKTGTYKALKIIKQYLCGFPVCWLVWFWLRFRPKQLVAVKTTWPVLAVLWPMFLHGAASVSLRP